MTQSVLNVDREMLVEPDHIVQPPPWAGHVPFAYWLMANHRPAIFVELGTHTGLSYGLFCQAVLQNRLETRCFAVDTWTGDEHAGYYGDDVLEGLKKWHDPRYAGFSRLLQTTFDIAVDSFDDNSIDLLHIDGLHTYGAVKHDFETWLPRLSERGIILFHDVAVREKDFGVWRLWDELSALYPAVRFDHSNGLGVLFVGSESLNVNALQILLSQYRDDPELLQRFYSQLGQRIEQRCRLSSLSIEADERLELAMVRGEIIATLEVTLQRQQMALDEQSGAIASRQHEMEVQRELIERQQIGIGEQSEAIIAQQHEMEAQRELIVHQQAVLEEQSEVIVGQKTVIDRLEGERAELLETTSKHEQAMQSLKQSLEDGEVQRQVMQKQLTSCEADRCVLHQARADLEHQRDMLAMQQHSILHSRSWRITRPLRKLTHWLRG